MALDKRTILDQIEVRKDGVIFVKELNQIVEDGVVLTSTPHRTVINPNEDITNAIDAVKKAASVFWTPEVIQEYIDSRAEALNGPMA